MTTRKKTYQLLWRRLVLLGFLVAAMALCADCLVAASDAKAFLPGGWAADQALQFDPFSLITSADYSVVPPAPAAPKAARGVSKSASGGSGDPVVGAQVRVPYRPASRSPFRPPL